MRTDLGSVHHQSRTAPNARTGDPSPLSQLLRRRQAWSRERVAIPRPVRRLLWLLILAQLAWAAWLTLMVTTGTNTCAGIVCTVATLDGHLALLLLCSALSLGGLVTVAIVTRGLSSSDGRETSGLTVSIATGGVALLGVTALLCVLAILTLTAVILFATLAGG